MVQKPQDWVATVAKYGGKQFTFHYEATFDDIEKLIQEIKDNNMRVGLALKPKTQVDDTIRDLIGRGLIDTLLVMTVEPGFGG